MTCALETTALEDKQMLPSWLIFKVWTMVSFVWMFCYLARRNSWCPQNISFKYLVSKPSCTILQHNCPLSLIFQGHWLEFYFSEWSQESTSVQIHCIIASLLGFPFHMDCIVTWQEVTPKCHLQFNQHNALQWIERWHSPPYRGDHSICRVGYLSKWGHSILLSF